MFPRLASGLLVLGFALIVGLLIGGDAAGNGELSLALAGLTFGVIVGMLASPRTRLSPIGASGRILGAELVSYWILGMVLGSINVAHATPFATLFSVAALLSTLTVYVSASYQDRLVAIGEVVGPSREYKAAHHGAYATVEVVRIGDLSRSRLT